MHVVQDHAFESIFQEVGDISGKAGVPELILEVLTTGFFGVPRKTCVSAHAVYGQIGMIETRISVGSNTSFIEGSHR